MSSVARAALARFPAALALLVAPLAPAAAQRDAVSEGMTAKTAALRLVDVGTWRFATRAADRRGRPLCREVWRFAADGEARVESGRERLTKRWRTLPGPGGLVRLAWQSTASNGAPDCTGTATDPASLPGPEADFVLLFLNDGSALACTPPPAAANPDTTLESAQVVRAEACWGRIVPAPQG
mgnify:CR=1 FL=1